MNATDRRSVESEYLRLFIAIDTSPEIKEKLGRVQEELRRLDNGVRWVAPEIMHFTLAFLGDIPSGDAAAVAAAMDGIGAANQAFPCEISGLGFFGSRNSPRVIWAGIRTDPSLPAMHGALCTRLRELDITLEDRPFRPHLTLGRVRSIRNIGPFMRKVQSYADTSFGEVSIDSMLLIRSILKPQGPEYSILHTACLATPRRP